MQHLMDQVDEKLSQKEATKMKEPPCHLGGLYKAGKKNRADSSLIFGNIHQPTMRRMYMFDSYELFLGWWFLIQVSQDNKIG